jgi:signal transduction histidine kinase/HAMP domain-containing protein
MSAPDSGTQRQAAKGRRHFSITQKLLALFGAATVGLVIVLSAFFLRQQISDSRAALQRKAAAYGALSARQVAPAVAFDDRQTAREVFDAVALDNDIESMTLLNANGEVLHARGAAGAWISAAKGGVQEQRIVELSDKIAVVSPVVSAEGPRGTLVIELSTRQLEAAVVSMTTTAVAVGLFAIAVGMLLAYIIASSLGRRIGAVAQAAVAVSNGDLDQPAIVVKGSDEVADLAQGFNVMMLQIQRLFSQARETAATEKSRLEHLVQERTHELDRRTADMRLVLDNVSQGFLTVGLDGTMSRERSAIVDTWLGVPREGESLFAYIDRALPGKGDYLRVGWDALNDDWMPLEMRLGQLPAEFRTDKLHLGFAYQPIQDGDALHKLLVIVTDMAPLAERARAEAEERELVQVVRKLLGDHSGFREYIDEASALVTDIVGPDPDRERRQRLLHTLKGNSAIFGFDSMVRLCHELEENVQNGAAQLSAEDNLRLTQAWDRLRAKVAALMGGRSNELLEVSRADLQHVVANLNAGARASLITRLIRAWELEPTESRLSRLQEYTRSLAGRLEKAPISVEIEDNDVRLHPTAWVGFWQAMVHVVRNAVDHGLEGPDARRARGKAETGHIRMRTTLEGNRFQVFVSDDGCGVDWAKIARLAQKRRLPTGSHEQLVAALLSDGMTTRDQASQTSGRGVGLSAMRDACAANGGTIDVQTELGKGTTFCFTFQVDAQGQPVMPAPHASDSRQLAAVGGMAFITRVED